MGTKHIVSQGRPVPLSRGDRMTLFNAPVFSIDSGHIRGSEVRLEYRRESGRLDRFHVVLHEYPKDHSKADADVSSYGTHASLYHALEMYCRNLLKSARRWSADLVVNVDPMLVKCWEKEALEIADQVPEISVFDACEGIKALRSFELLEASVTELRERYALQRRCDFGEARPDWFARVEDAEYQAVSALLESVDITETDALGNTILHACEGGAEHVFRYVRSGAAVNARNSVGDTPLHCLANNWHGFSTLALECKGTVDLTTRNEWGLYALDLVSSGNWGRLFSEFVSEAFTAVRARDELGLLRPGNAIHDYANEHLLDAINDGDQGEIDSLLGMGFKPPIPPRGEMDECRYPLCAALIGGNWGLVDRLISIDPVRCSEFFGDVSNYYDILVPESRAKAVSLALALNSDIGCENDWACVFESSVADSEIERYLKRNQSNLNNTCRDGLLLLNVAISSGHARRIGLLVSLGADPDFRDIEGRSAWDVLEHDGSPASRAALDAALLKRSTTNRSIQEEGLGL